MTYYINKTDFPSGFSQKLACDAFCEINLALRTIKEFETSGRARWSMEFEKNTLPRKASLALLSDHNNTTCTKQ